MKTIYRLARRARRTVGRLQRPWRRLLRPLIAAPRAAADPLEPSPGVAAFLAGETIRQVAYFVGAADPGIIDPREDWTGALADAHGVIRDHIGRQTAHITHLQRELAAGRLAAAGPRRPGLISRLMNLLRGAAQ
jgi:hypothetical protein